MRLGGWSASRAARLLWSLTLLLSFNVVLSRRVVAADSIPRGSTTLAGMQFAFADLDGDHKPDLALVEVQSERANSTSYAIRLQFSGGPGSSIGVKAPSGGLRLVVRDVNGDDSLDLVLTSAMDRHVIQVLLNDGHGKFAAAEAGSFPTPEDGDGFGFCERDRGPSDHMVLAGTRTFFDSETVSRQITVRCEESTAGVMRCSGVVLSGEPAPRVGRSPPEILTVP